MNGPTELANRFIATQRGWLLTAIPALGLSSAALIYVSILADVIALFQLHRRARATCDSGFPPLQSALGTRLAGLASPVLVPPIFVGVWLFLMLRGWPANIRDRRGAESP